MESEDSEGPIEEGDGGDEEVSRFPALFLLTQLSVFMNHQQPPPNGLLYGLSNDPSGWPTKWPIK